MISDIEGRLSRIEKLLGLCPDCGHVVKFWKPERREEAVKECVQMNVDPYSGHSRICVSKPAQTIEYFEFISKFNTMVL